MVESDDEDTCTVQAFKQPRVGVIGAPSASVLAGAPTFIDHPPNAYSPFQRLHSRVGERVPPVVKRQNPPRPSLCC